MSNSREITKRSLVLTIGFLCYFSAMVLNVYSTTVFLDKVGADKIPALMVLVSIAGLLFSVLNSVLSNKIAPIKIFYYLLLPIIAIFSGVFYFSPNDTFQIGALYVLSGFWYYFIGIGVSNMGFSAVSSMQSKSFQPLLNSVTSFGEIIGAMILNYLAISTLTAISNITIGILLLINLLVLICAKVFSKDFSSDAESEDYNPGWQELKSMFSFIFKKSGIFKYLSLIVISYVFLDSFTEYHMLADLESKMTEDQISGTLAATYGIQNTGIVILNLFFARMILFNGGVTNILVIFPLALVLVLLATISTGYSSLTIIALFLAFSIPYFTFIDSAITQVFSLAPKKLKQPTYFLIKGALTSVAGLIASAILLIYSFRVDLVNYLSTIFVTILLILAWWFAVKLRNNAARDIGHNLAEDDQYLRLQSIDFLAERAQKNKGEVELRKLILQNKHHDTLTRVAAIRSLGLIGNPDSIVELYTTLEEGSPKEIMISIKAITSIIQRKSVFKKIPITQHKLIQVYEKMLISSLPLYIKQEVIRSLKYFEITKVINFLENQLHNAETEIAINAIETIGEFNDRSIIVYLKPMLRHKDPRILAATIAALWRFTEMRLTMIPIFQYILDDQEKLNIQSNLRLISEIHATWEEHYIDRFLTSPDPEIKIAAITAKIGLGRFEFFQPFVDELLALKVTENQDLTDNGLLEYRALDKSIQKKLFKFIKSLPAEKVEEIAKIFNNSKFNFEEETTELGLTEGY